MTCPDQAHQTEPPGATGEGAWVSFESCGVCACKISVSAYMCGCVSRSVFLLNLVFFCFFVFFTSFVPLFDVQIVGCQPGLAVVSKLEVSKLISGSINEALSVWPH